MPPTPHPACLSSSPAFSLALAGGRGLLALRNKGFHGDGDEDRHRTKEPGFLRHLSMEKVP